MLSLKRTICTSLLIFNYFLICQARNTTRPLKILVFETYFPPKTSTAVLNQITGLLDRGHDVYIYAKEAGAMKQAHPDIKKYDLMKRVYFNKNRLHKNRRSLIRKGGKNRLHSYLSNRRKRRSKKYLRNLPPDLDSFDIIYCPFGYRGIEFLNVIKREELKVKFVIGFRGADLSRDIYYDVYRYDNLFKQGDLFLPVCDYFAQKLCEFGCPKDKIVVLHSAIDCKTFCYKKKKFSKVKNVRILSICRFVEKKGLEYAIKAVAVLLKKNKNIEYHLIGEGPLKSNLLNLIKKLGVGNKIKIKGYASQREVAQALSSAHLFLLPSITAYNGDEEGIPNSIKEAMAMRVIPISTYHAGIPELIKDGAGFLVPQKNIKVLTEKIEYFIKHPELWEKMSNIGRTIIETEFDKECVNDQLECIFNDLVQCD